jgi:hypothetical protein
LDWARGERQLLSKTLRNHGFNSVILGDLGL